MGRPPVPITEDVGGDGSGGDPPVLVGSSGGIDGGDPGAAEQVGRRRSRPAAEQPESGQHHEGDGQHRGSHQGWRCALTEGRCVVRSVRARTAAVSSGRGTEQRAPHAGRDCRRGRPLGRGGPTAARPPPPDGYGVRRGGDGRRWRTPRRGKATGAAGWAGRAACAMPPRTPRRRCPRRRPGPRDGARTPAARPRARPPPTRTMRRSYPKAVAGCRCVTPPVSPAGPRTGS